MRVVLQRVRHASVTVEERVVGEIQKGYLLLVGFARDDFPELLQPMIDKILKVRVFSDETGRFAHSLEEVDGSLLVISQFTLFADMKKGKKISWSRACEPGLAESLYNDFVAKLKVTQVPVAFGVFGAAMQVSLENEGPVTLIFDSKELFPSLYS